MGAACAKRDPIRYCQIQVGKLEEFLIGTMPARNCPLTRPEAHQRRASANLMRENLSGPITYD